MGSTLYWARIREQDGSWTDWRQVDRDYFERVHGRYEFDTCTTPAHPTTQEPTDHE